MALKARSPGMMDKMTENVKDRQMGTEFVKGHMILSYLPGLYL
jgi:hypothetical protein